MSLTTRLTTLAAVAALTTGGAIALDAAKAPAANAACYSGLTEFKAKNVSCKPQMRHWIVSRTVGTKYGQWVSPGGTSQQKACYVNLASRGVTVRHS